MDDDSLGNRMKEIEQVTAGIRLVPGLPVMARIDGRCFSKWTRGLARPYDQRLSDAMVETTRFVVEEFRAIVGYTQSDEISLILPPEDPMFGGKVCKLASTIASSVTAKFNSLVPSHVPERVGRLATFDARVWVVPSQVEAVNCVLWRENDAYKNAISMAARHYYSHKALQGLNGKQMQELLFQKGLNFNDYPSFFKRGSYVQRRRRMIELPPEQLERIPEQYRPTGPVERHVVEVVQMPPLARVVNRVQVIFDGADPLVMADDQERPA